MDKPVPVTKSTSHIPYFSLKVLIDVDASLTTVRTVFDVEGLSTSPYKLLHTHMPS
jgi:hypothetical protein